MVTGRNLVVVMPPDMHDLPTLQKPIHGGLLAIERPPASLGRERRGKPSQANGSLASNHYYDDASMFIPEHSITLSGTINGKMVVLIYCDKVALLQTGYRQAV